MNSTLHLGLPALTPHGEALLAGFVSRWTALAETHDKSMRDAGGQWHKGSGQYQAARFEYDKALRVLMAEVGRAGLRRHFLHAAHRAAPEVNCDVDDWGGQG